MEHLALEVPSGMYKQFSCLHIQQLLDNAPDLHRLSPAEPLAELVGSCDRDHGDEVDHDDLVEALGLLMVGEYGLLL